MYRVENLKTIEENHLQVSRTARYYTYGQPTTKTKYLWFVCHGYGQAAASFIKKFSTLNTEQHFVVAPEALSRFYWNGFGGKSVASWMTKEDRNNEIADYINYLNTLYQTIGERYKEVLSNNDLQIRLMGFLQGVATVSRWLANGQITADELIIWAGNLAHDIDWKQAKHTFITLKKLSIVYGTDDEFIQQAYIDNGHTLLKKLGINSHTLSFKGGHTVPADIVRKYFN